MPDQWQSTDDHAPVAGGDWQSTDDHSAHAGKDASPSLSGFGSNILKSGADLLGGIGHAILHPIDSATGVATALAGASPVKGPPGSWQHDVAEPQANAVGGFYKERYGGIPEIAHTLYTDPVGAIADASVLAGGADAALRGGAAVADAANAGRMANGMRTAANAARDVATYTNPVSLAGKGIGAAASKALGVRSGLSPIEAAAVDYAIGDPALSGSVDAATASGNQFLNSAKSLLRKSPASAGIIGDAEKAQQAAIIGKMSDVADMVSPGGARFKAPAGINLQAAITKKLAEYGAAAKDAYANGVVAKAKASPQYVQVGSKVQYSLDPTVPATTMPVMDYVAGPTKTAAVKAVAQPILDQLEAELPEAQKQMSPTVSLLRQIINRPDMVSIETAIADNSAIQNIARTEMPQLRSKVQGVTAKLVSPYRDAIDEAAKAIGPDAYQALQNGRGATKAKYDLGGTVNARQLNSRPVETINLLTTPDDGRVSALQKLQQHVPAAIPDVARATVERIFRHTTENGTLSRLDGALNKWNALGPQTKQILFGTDTSEEITNLLRYAKMASKEVNPSGTAGVGHVAGLAALLLRDPMSAIAAMAGSRAMSRAMFNPETAAAIRQTGSIPLPQPGRIAAAAVAPLNPKVLNTERAVNARANPYR